MQLLVASIQRLPPLDMGADNLFSHLTNSSINKHSPTYHDHKDTIGPGCKWSLEELWCHLAGLGVKGFSEVGSPRCGPVVP